METMIQPWIPHPTVLEGEHVILRPLEHSDLDELYRAASDPQIWTFIPTDCSDRKQFDSAYEAALSERTSGKQYPFVIISRPGGEIIGSTRLLELFPKDLKLEIGWTWILPRYWGTTVNLECKLLLLSFCFNNLGARRVQLKTKETNVRSRRAIEKIGGSFEGILRKDRIQANGVSRNSAYFSILDDEWEGARNKILKELEKKKKEHT